jgi:hypothetical protein
MKKMLPILMLSMMLCKVSGQDTKKEDIVKQFISLLKNGESNDQICNSILLNCNISSMDSVGVAGLNLVLDDIKSRVSKAQRIGFRRYADLDKAHQILVIDEKLKSSVYSINDNNEILTYVLLESNKIKSFSVMNKGGSGVFMLLY